MPHRPPLYGIIFGAFFFANMGVGVVTIVFKTDTP